MSYWTRIGKGTRGEIWILDTKKGQYHAKVTKGRNYPTQMWKWLVKDPQGRVVYSSEFAFAGRKTVQKTREILNRIVHPNK